VCVYSIIMIVVFECFGECESFVSCDKVEN
jgi:hypothetical protein